MLVGSQTIPTVVFSPSSGVRLGLPTVKLRIWLLDVAHVDVSRPSAAHCTAAVACSAADLVPR